MSIPKYDELFNPVLSALHKLGGEATIDEIEEAVVKDLQLTQQEITEIHRKRRTKINYRLATVCNPM